MMVRVRNTLVAFFAVTALGFGQTTPPKMTRRAPTVADWTALGKLPDFTGVWEIPLGGPARCAAPAGAGDDRGRSLHAGPAHLYRRACAAGRPRSEFRWDVRRALGWRHAGGRERRLRRCPARSFISVQREDEDRREVQVVRSGYAEH